MRKSVERQMFRQPFKYRIGLVNKYILIIRHCDDQRRASAYRNLVFRMMGHIVLKNITNYINLLNGSNAPDIPSRDEAIADCYAMFDKCIEKFTILPGANFYFYFNKSIARNFYTLYKKNLKARHSEISDAVESSHPDMRVPGHVNDMEITFDTLGFTDLERRITMSRLAGQRKSEFLADNPDVTENLYSRVLVRMKKLLENIKKEYHNGKKD